MTYEEVMQYINNTARFGSNLGLERTKKILELLGNPHKKLKLIHVAGTNGKGSTTAMISRMLINNGYKVGMYTSPYLEEFEERIQINEHNISKEDLVSVVIEVSKAVDEVISLGYTHPTQFEIITCSMFLYFYKKNIDYGVIEVGLGGRLDSTNVITPIISVITSISYDHMQILGNNLAEIAFEKAGIIKEGVPVVVYPEEEEAQKIIEDVCKNKNSKLIKVPKDCAKVLENIIEVENEKNNKISKVKQKYLQHIAVNTSEDIYDIKLSLLGTHQILNCCVAIFAIEALKNMGININKEKTVEALSKVYWKGRFEVMKSEPLVVIDGAHNIDGILRLRESVEKYFKYNRIILILGILADKEVGKMVKVIAPIASKIITVTPHSDRAEVADELCKEVKKYNDNCEVEKDYARAYEKAVNYAESGDLILVSGSLYMIGDMRTIIKND